MFAKKKGLITVLLAFILLIGAASYYLHASGLLDLNEYKNDIISRMENILKTDVAIGDIRLSIINGIKVRLKNITVGKGTDTFFSIEEVTAGVHLLPLFLKKVIVKEVVLIRPSINIQRNKNGDITFMSIFSKKPVKKDIVHFPLIKKIKIEGGNIKFTDRFAAPDPLITHCKNLDFVLKKHLFKRSFYFDISCFLADGVMPAAITVNGQLENFFIRNKIDFSKMKVSGDIAINSLRASKFWKYYSQYVPAIPFDTTPFNEIDYLMDSDIHYSWRLAGKMKSSGRITLRTVDSGGDIAFIDPARLRKGGIYYEMEAENDSVDFEKLEIFIGKTTLHSRLLLKRVSYNNILARMRIDAPAFNVDEIKKILEYKILPEDISGFLEKDVTLGNIKIGPIDFIGTLDQMINLNKPENLNLLKGNIELHNISLKPGKKLLPIKNLNGTMYIEKNTLHLSGISASYGNSKLRDIEGSISDLFTSPHMEITTKGRLNLQQILDAFKSSGVSGDIKSLVRSVKIIDGLADFNVKISGKIKAPPSFKTEGSLSLIHVNLKYENKILPISDIEGRIDFNENTIKLSNVTGRFENTPISLKGKVTSYKSKTPELLLHMHSKIKGEYINKLIVKDMNFTGDVDLALAAKGWLNNIAITSSIDLTNASYKFSKWIKKPMGVMNKISIAAKIDNLAAILFKRINIILNSKELVSIQGKISLKNPQVNFKIDNLHLYLNDIKDITVFLESKDSKAKGEIKGKIEIKRGMDIEKGFGVYGSLDLKSSGIKLPKNFPQISECTAHIQIKREMLSIDRAKIKIGSSSIRLNGKIENIYKPKIVFKIHSPLMNVDEIITLLPEKDSHPEMRGEITIDKGSYKQFTFKNLAGDLVVGKNSAIINSLTFKSFDGDFDIKGRLGLPDRGAIDIRLDVNAKKIVFRKLLKKFLPKYNKLINGTLALSSHLSSSGNKGSEIIKNLTGQLNLSLKKGVIDKSGFSKTDTKDTDTDKDTINFDEISTDFVIKEGTAFTENLLMKVKGIKVVTAAGSIELIKGLIDARVCRKTHAFIDSIITKIPIIRSLLTGKKQSVALKCFDIEGDIKSPDIKKASSESIRDKIIGIVPKILEIPKEAISPLFK